MSNMFDVMDNAAPAPIEAEIPKTEDAPVDAPVDSQEFSFDSFNKTFGVDYKDVDSVKGVFDKASKYDQVFTEREQFSKRVSELEVLEEKVNPLSFFSSPDAYLREQFLLKNPSLDPGVLKVVSDLTPGKIEELSPLKALQVQMLVANPSIDGGEEGVAELIADKYGVSIEELEDYESLDRKVKNKIKLDGQSARGDLKKLYDGIDVPQKVDLNQVRADIKTSWESPLKEMVKGIDKLSIAEGLDFIVTDEMKAGLFEERLSQLSNGLVKPTTEVAQELASEIRKELLTKNLDKIVQFIDKTSEEKWKAHFRGAVHNTTPLNDQNRDNATNQGFSDLLKSW